MPEIKSRTGAESESAPKATKQIPRRYFLVNPKGAIHEVTRDLAAERLRVAGWRLATPEEIARLAAQGGHQVFDAPICRPWSPDPDAQLDLE